MDHQILDFEAADAVAVNAVALEAFAEYRDAYSDWPALARRIGNMSSLAASGEIIVAKGHETVFGAVAYMGAGKSRAEIFKPEWPVMRMLVVRPHLRGRGIGRALAQECIRRAIRDDAEEIALHTSPLMTVALSMYERMGFRKIADAPALFDAPYGIYLKRLSAD
jgi:ribosomal protein S18 acetylase RimI-like enzyme